MDFIPSEKAFQELYESIDLFQRSSVYHKKLKKADELRGKLKLKVIHNLLQRLVRYQEIILTDLEEKGEIFSAMKNELSDKKNEDYDEFLLAKCGDFLRRIEDVERQFSKLIKEQNEDQLRKLQELFPE